LAKLPKLVVVGVGLIGGSFALALKSRGVVGEVVGVGRTQRNLEEAIAAGVVDRVATRDSAWTRELADADIVLLATPVGEFPALFAALPGALAEGAVVTEALDVIASGTARWTPQDEASATYAPMVRRDETRVDWALPAVEIERRIRAFRPDPGAFTVHDGTRLKILAAAVGPSTPGAEPGSIDPDAASGVRVACGKESLLLSIVQPEGGRAIPARDYFRGRGAGRARVFATSAE